MTFWIFMLLMDLLIPLTMIGFGKCFLKGIPRERNGLFGYRTSMSMKNNDTWQFAHHYCGRIWFVGGLILLPLTILPLLFVIGRTEDQIGTIGGLVCGVQMIPLIGSIIPTEIALRKTFDKNGSRRQA